MSLRALATTVPPKVTGANPLHPRSGGRGQAGAKWVTRQVVETERAMTGEP